MGLALNIGCGDKIFKNIGPYPCINVDIRNLDGIDLICDVKSLPFSNESFDRVLASDIIEHFPIADTNDLLREWVRVLKVDGNMKFRTPSLKWASTEYLRTGDAKFVSWHLYGGQDYPSNFHYVIFDREWLLSLCKEFNLHEIDYKEVGSNMELVVKKK